MARKERGEFVFSAFSSFLLAWPVRRLVMHDRCRYMYSAGCTRSGAKHRWKSPLCLSSLFPHPHFIHEEEEGFVSHSFPDLWKVRAREIQKIGQSDRFPANVPQMNDHLESHKPFFSATEIHGSNDRKILKPIPADFPFPAERRKLAFLIPRLFKSFDFAIRKWYSARIKFTKEIPQFYLEICSKSRFREIQDCFQLIKHVERLKFNRFIDFPNFRYILFK